MKRIKENIRFACLAVLAIGFAACSQDELSSPTGGVEGAPVQIGSVSIGRSVETRVSENPADAGKSSVWDFDGTEQIGVRVNNGIKGVYTLNADKSITTTEPTYWTSSGSQTVRAWYPLECDHIDLSNQSAGNLAYALYTAVSGSYASEAPLALNFSHKLAKVRVLLKGDPEAITQIEAKNFASCSLNPIGGAVTGSDESYIPLSRVTYATTDGNKETYWEANLAPGKAGTDVLLLNGKLIQSIQGVTQLESGKMYTVTLVVANSDVVTFEDCTITDWENPDNDITGNVVLSPFDYLFDGDTYYVYTEAGLRAWAEHVNAGNWYTNCTLMNDINLTPNEDGSSNWPLVGRMEPYGSYMYRGTFDGAGHQVDYITMKTGTEYQKNLGFICSVVDGGTVKNLTIGKNSTFVASDCEGTGSVVGGVFGGGRIINCHSYASVTGHRYIGGIVGRVGYIRDNEGNLVAGCSFSGTISYHPGSRYYDKYVGGIVGYTYCSQTTDNGDNILNSVHVVGCYHAGSINVATEESDDGIGGLAGSMTTFYYGRLVYTGCYSTDALSSAGTTGRVGGLIGEVFDTATATATIGIPSLSACYWSNHSGVGVGYGSSSLAESNIGFVDNNNTDWATATVNMNAAIKEWNATHDNLCPYHYVQTNGENQPPTLVEGAPN